MSLPEAQQLCFREADSFEKQTLRFTPEQTHAIEKKSGLKLQARGIQSWIARQGTNLLGVLFLDHVLGKHEIIDYVVAVAPDGRVRQVEIVEYRESYGHEVRSAKWRDQLVGKSAGSPLRLNEDIYNISGATVSCRSVTDGIKRVLAIYDLVMRPRVALAGRMPNQTENQSHPGRSRR